MTSILTLSQTQWIIMSSSAMVTTGFVLDIANGQTLTLTLTLPLILTLTLTLTLILHVCANANHAYDGRRVREGNTSLARW